MHRYQILDQPLVNCSRAVSA
ncbi:hypothetical protein VCHC57A2_2541, partial [Vibrio cholerae HC-57A2]